MGHVLGACSICGGDVTMPNAWYATQPPKPTCVRCGAKPVDTRPVIPMAPKTQVQLPMPDELGFESLSETLHGLG